MSDIELVIKIPKYLYKVIQSYKNPTKEETAIANGTPLPKGHGDLKDVNKLKNAFIKWSMAVQGSFTDSDIASIVYNSPTIIEADKAESEDRRK